MRGRGVIAGVLAVCGAVVLSGPARADQYDFVTGARQCGGERPVDQRHDRYRQVACHDLRRGRRPGVLGRLQDTGFAASESAIILVSAVNNMCVDTKPAVVGWARDNGYTGPV